MANDIERITIAFPKPMADAIREAVDDGQYATTSEVVRDAVRDWTRKRGLEDPVLVARLREAAHEAKARGGAKPFNKDALLADIHARKAREMDGETLAAETVRSKG